MRLAAVDIGVRHHDLAVETARTQKGRIENVGTVGRRDQDDAFIGLKAVHLDQQLVQRLLAFVVAAAETGAAMATDGVDFVDEDDAGRILLGLFEHVAHTACADADEHFDEVRTGDGEEGNVGFACDRAGKQRLTGTGRADEQHAARNTSAEPLELLRVAQEFDDFFQILLGFIDTGNVVKGDAAMRFRQKLGLGFAKAHGASRTALHLTHEEQPDAEDQKHWQQRADIAQEPGGAVGFRTNGHRHVLGFQTLGERGVNRRCIGLERRAAFRIAADDLGAGDHDFLDAARIDVLEELRERNLARAGALGRLLKHAKQRDQQKRYDCP